MLLGDDTLTVTEDMKIKVSSSVVKIGAKVRKIRLVDGDRDIDCKIERHGLMPVRSAS